MENEMETGIRQFSLQEVLDDSHFSSGIVDPNAAQLPYRSSWPKTVLFMARLRPPEPGFIPKTLNP